MPLANVVLVTGAAGGIGYEIVRTLLAELEAGVVATDIVEGGLQKLKEQYPSRIHIVIGDIVDPKTSETSVNIAIREFGKLTGVCLNAGVFGPCYRIEKAPVSKWETAFQINVFSQLHTLKYALPELRKTKGRVTATTSGAGYAPLFSGWGFYGMSKASVGYLVKQLNLEEPDVTVVGVSPGLCDTKMVKGLLTGEHEGWGEADVKKYEAFVSQIELITPAHAGHVFALTVTKADPSISGLVVDYDDPRLPIEEHLKRKDGKETIDYTQHSVDTKSD